ncbi:MAG: type secretion system protein [Planctomycetaceae bacterium]|nr:type secretion system protein [Planctomycetaceae bacterium]
MKINRVRAVPSELRGASLRDSQSKSISLAVQANISRTRSGLTLFEVLLALVIFVGALTAIGQLLSSGIRGALQSRYQLQAAQMCQAKMGEVVCGAQPLRAMTAVYPDDPAWSWSLQVIAAPVPGLMKVEVMVQRLSQHKNKKAEIKFSMIRYVRDPAVYLAAEEEATRNAQQEAEAK